MTDDFEFWALKEGADGLTRTGVRVLGQGQRRSWLVPSDEAETDVLKRWATDHLEQLGFMPPWGTGLDVIHSWTGNRAIYRCSITLGSASGHQ